MKNPFIRTSKTKDSGFTLVEVVITVLLVTIVMIPITRLSYTIMYSTAYARDVGEALAAGSSQLEAFEAMDSASIANGSSTEGPYQLSWVVTTTIDGDKVVNLTISWDILSRNQSVQLNTVYSPDN